MSLILSGTDGLSDVDGTAATPAIRGTDANTGIFFGTDIIGFSEGGVEAARINADSQFVAAAGTAALPVITTTGDTNTGIFFPAADTIAFSEGGVEAMRIDSSGNVGIGTASPVSRLHVTGSGSPYISVTSTNTNNFVQALDASGLAIGTTSSATNKDVLFFSGSAERARIDSNGNFLVNTTTVTASGQVCMDFLGTSAEGLTIKNTVNTTNSAFVQFYNSSATKIGSISNPTSSSIAYNTSSDYRLKNTIAPMTGALARVAALKPCTYKWNADGADGEGFIAHELAEVCPSAVTGEKDAVDADGNIKPQGIDTSFLVATLTAAIQEQQALITQLTARITALESA